MSQRTAPSLLSLDEHAYASLLQTNVILVKEELASFIIDLRVLFNGARHYFAAFGGPFTATIRSVSLLVDVGEGGSRGHLVAHLVRDIVSAVVFVAASRRVQVVSRQ